MVSDMPASLLFANLFATDGGLELLHPTTGAIPDSH